MIETLARRGRVAVAGIAARMPTANGCTETQRGAVRRRPRRIGLRRPNPGVLASISTKVQVAADAMVDVNTDAVRVGRWWRLTATLTVVGALVAIGTVAFSAPATGTHWVTVKSGDTLWSIAQRSQPDQDTGAVVDAIETLNGLADSNLVYEGELLKVPIGSS